MEMILQEIPLDELVLDRRNPRLPDVDMPDQDTALETLAQNADLGELVDSISNAGWINFEPLIVTIEGGENVVIEGNRRLAALKIIRDRRLQELVGVYPPKQIHAEAQPEKLHVNLVASREAAREFIGFKHINGAFRWDSYAKAKFAHEWYTASPDLNMISKKLGDSHSTVSRLINAYSVLHQAEHSGFDRHEIEKKNLHFSHLYTALPAPSVRKFLGIDEVSAKEVLTEAPIPADHTENLVQLMTWLYGQGRQAAVVRTQNPDLGKLVKILGDSRATSALNQENDLSYAFTMVIDRSDVFSKSILRLRKSAKEALDAVPGYDGSSDSYQNMQDIADTIDVLGAQVSRRYRRALNEASDGGIDG
ncbi:ParB N-terminal domain-containing protein [Glutamicibacter sp. NPDC090743]|uniref:ParB N-terminal domain-containing protein n=1 Tax=Glutamicibacter sp. NPDC090743 TaxID=3364001 RepID=UPI00380BCCEA